MRAKIRGTEIFFDVDGPALAVNGGRMVERPVLFLLHGGPGGDHANFKTTLASLHDTAQLVFIDHRGSGRSSRCDLATNTLDENVHDIEALREYLGLERISLLGSSYGGMVAQGYAIRYPTRVANLVLAATAPSFRFLQDAQQLVHTRGTDEQKRVCQWLWDGSFQSQQQLYEYYRAMGPWYSTRFDQEKFEASWNRSIRNFEQLNLGFGSFLREFDFIDQLPQITCPTLVLAGAHDWICPPRHADILFQQIPRAHLKVFAHSAHAIAEDEPEAYLAAVRGFLTYARK